MSTNAKQYYQNVASEMKPVRLEMPDVVKGFRELHQAAFKAGALSSREKELIALSIGRSALRELHLLTRKGVPCCGRNARTGSRSRRRGRAHAGRADLHLSAPRG